MKLDVKNIYDWPLSSRLIFLLIVMAIVVAAGYWWDLSALNRDISDAKKQEEDLKLQLASSVRKEQKLSQEVAHYNEIQTLLSRWQKRIVAHTQLPQLLNEILKIGSSNHLNFALFNPEQESVVTVYRLLPIKIVAVGTYHQIGDFFSQLANLQWIVMIGDFAVSNENSEALLGAKVAKEAKAQNLLTAEVILNVYHYPDPSDLTIITPEKDAKPGTSSEAPPGSPQTQPTPPAATSPPATTPTTTPPPTSSAPSETANAPKT